MSYVRRNPLGDPGVFCGNERCGLCFNWQDDASAEITDGIVWIWQALTEKPGVEPYGLDQLLQLDQVRQGLIAAHINVRKLVDDVASVYDDEQGRLHLQRQLAAAAAAKIKELGFKKIVKTVLLDNLQVQGNEFVVPAEQTKVDKVPEPVKVAEKQQVSVPAFKWTI